MQIHSFTKLCHLSLENCIRHTIYTFILTQLFSLYPIKNLQKFLNFMFRVRKVYRTYKSCNNFVTNSVISSQPVCKLHLKK